MIMKYLLSIFIILFSTFFLLISYEKTKWGSNVIHEIVENRKKNKYYSQYSREDIEVQIRTIWKIASWFLLIFGIFSFIILLLNGGKGLYINNTRVIDIYTYFLSNIDDGFIKYRV